MPFLCTPIYNICNDPGGSWFWQTECAVHQKVHASPPMVWSCCWKAAAQTGTLFPGLPYILVGRVAESWPMGCVWKWGMLSPALTCQYFPLCPPSSLSLAIHLQMVILMQPWQWMTVQSSPHYLSNSSWVRNKFYCVKLLRFGGFLT